MLAEVFHRLIRESLKKKTSTNYTNICIGIYA